MMPLINLQLIRGMSNKTRTKKMKITETDIDQIEDSLSEYYTAQESEEMLEAAIFDKTEDGVKVTYDNGKVDYYEYKRVLQFDYTFIGDKVINEDDKIMRLDTKPGEKVKFLGKHGRMAELLRAKKLFKKGDILTVKEMNIGCFSSNVTFKSTGGEVFNTVMFENVD